MAISFDEAREVVSSYLKSLETGHLSSGLALLDKYTREVPCGWVFFYQSRRFLQTNDFREFLCGNSPILVDSRDGSLHMTGTAREVDYYVQNYLDTGNTQVEGVPILILSGWKEGANKVSATRLLNRQTSLGLARSKQCIDDALQGVTTKLQLASFEEAENLLASLDELGWIVSVERGSPGNAVPDASA